MRYAFLFAVLLISLTFCSFDLWQAPNAADDGEETYLTFCKSCHGKKGSSGFGGAAKLTKSNMELDERIEVITNGKGKMTPFGSILSKKEIKAVAKFTITLADD